jgi:ribosomal protein L37E
VSDPIVPPPGFRGRQPHEKEALERAPFKWRCGTCGTEHYTPPEDGCQSCGMGTQAEVARAVASREAETVTEAEFTRTVFAPPGDPDGEVFSAKAWKTIAAALAFYLAQGPPPEAEELPRVYVRAWLTRILEDDDPAKDDEDPTTD